MISKYLFIFFYSLFVYLRRDFRLIIADPKTGKKVIHPVIWFDTKSVITRTETTDSIVYEATFLRRQFGWFAFFIQLSFPGLEDTALEVATEVNIIPETYPYADCYGASCLGTLV